MKRNILGVILFVVVGGGYTAFDYFTGAEQGGPCTYNNDCKGSLFGKTGAQCLQDETGFYCTSPCSTHEDCPTGWTCETVSMTENGIETGETNSVCARPIPGQIPQAVPGQVPQPLPGQAVPGQPVPGQPVPGQPLPQPVVPTQ